MDILWISAFYFYTITGYFWFSARPTERHFLTSWDKYVPTIPIFLIPYLFATFTFLAVPIFFYIKIGWIKTKAFLITQIIATTLGYAVYFFWPTSVIREPIIGTGVLNDALRLLHANDRPSAAFPSGHVYNSIIIAYFCWIYFPASRPYIVVILPLIIASTVLLKQHYLPDIAGGIIVAIIAIILGSLITPKLP